MKLKKYDYIINDNGDVWFVEEVHRDGSATIVFPEGGTGDDTLTYSASEIESFFRRLPADRDYSDVSYLDPKPYWNPMKVKSVRKAKSKSRSKNDTPTSLRGMR